MTRQNWHIVGLLGAVALLGYQKKTIITNTVKNMLTPRGIRNNNAGNIRHSATKWRGQSKTQTDSAFVQFDTPEFGLRALSVLLDTYSRKYQLNTVNKLIARYAPSSENNTSAYAQAVAKALGVGVDQVFSVQARKADLIAAIVQHENGQQPYAMAQIQSGIFLA